MDDSSPMPRAGGTVEPADKAGIAKALLKRDSSAGQARFEVPDPRVELTYRSTSYGEVTAQADRLGSERIVQVDAVGQRTTIRRGADGWPKPKLEAVKSVRAAHPAKEPEPAKATPTSAEPAPAAAAKAPTVKVDRHEERQRLQAALDERYIVKRAAVQVGDVMVGQREYRFRGDAGRVAFTESTFRLATDSNNPSVARSMVDAAQARDWKALRVSGHDDFKRQVWLEAAIRGMKTVGYEPLPVDQALLRKAREDRQVNRIEPVKAEDTSGAAKGSSGRGGGGRNAVIAALDAVLKDRHVPEPQRTAVLVAAEEQLARRVAAGEQHRVKVYDHKAAPKRSVPHDVPAAQPRRERATPTR